MVKYINPIDIWNERNMLYANIIFGNRMKQHTERKEEFADKIFASSVKKSIQLKNFAIDRYKRKKKPQQQQPEQKPTGNS